MVHNSERAFETILWTKYVDQNSAVYAVYAGFWSTFAIETKSPAPFETQGLQGFSLVRPA